MYMHDSNILDNANGVRIPTVFAMETMMEPKYDESAVSAQNAVHELTDESCC